MHKSIYLFASSITSCVIFHPPVNLGSNLFNLLGQLVNVRSETGQFHVQRIRPFNQCLIKF
jgi:hypothetical protein